jgi:hypothetical protein
MLCAIPHRTLNLTLEDHFDLFDGLPEDELIDLYERIRDCDDESFGITESPDFDEFRLCDGNFPKVKEFSFDL